MINGPARRALGIECGYSCLGNNGRANATIGRALRLVMRNVGGAIPGAVSKSMFGQPGRISLCFGEWEEKSPWEPFHVRRGFAARRQRRHGPLRHGHAGHRRHLCRDRRGVDLGPRPLHRLDRQQQGAGAAGRRRDAAPAVSRLRPQDRARRPGRSPTCSACCTSRHARRSSAGIASTGRSSRRRGYVDDGTRAALCVAGAVSHRGRRRRVRASRAELLHLRPDLVGIRAVLARAAGSGEVCELPERS